MIPCVFYIRSLGVPSALKISSQFWCLHWESLSLKCLDILAEGIAQPHNHRRQTYCGMLLKSLSQPFARARNVKTDGRQAIIQREEKTRGLTCHLLKAKHELSVSLICVRCSYGLAFMVQC